MCCKWIGSNPSEVFCFRIVLRHMWLIYRGRRHPYQSVISEEGAPLSVRVFGTPYYGMLSVGLLSIYHRLQIHCIVNVNIRIFVSYDTFETTTRTYFYQITAFISGAAVCRFSSQIIQHSCFPVNIANFLGAPFSIEHLRWLFLLWC